MTFTVFTKTEQSKIYKVVFPLGDKSFKQIFGGGNAKAPLPELASDYFERLSVSNSGILTNETKKICKKISLDIKLAEKNGKLVTIYRFIDGNEGKPYDELFLSIS